MCLEKYLVEQCAPTLASLKTGSLFGVIEDDVGELTRQVAEWQAQLAPKGLILTILRYRRGRALIYMGRLSQLKRDLACPGAEAVSYTHLDVYKRQRMLNPRKLLVRAVVNVEIECYNRSELSVTTGLDGDGAAGVETLCEAASISPVVCVREKTFVVSDEYRLQPGLLPIGTLLWHTAEIIPVSYTHL